jgi:hypothetical protein
MDIETNGADSDSTPGNGRYMLPDEAAEFLGVKSTQLSHVLQRYGVGRYHQPVEGRQFVYARSDLERVKSLIDQESSADTGQHPD